MMIIERNSSGAGNAFDAALQRAKAIENKLSLVRGGKFKLLLPSNTNVLELCL